MVLVRTRVPALAYAASLLCLLGVTGAVCLDIAHGLLEVDPRYQVALLLTLTGGFVLAARHPRVPIRQAAALTLAAPLFAVTALAFALLALWIVGLASWGGGSIDERVTPILDLTALAFVLSALVLGVLWRRGALFLLSASLVLAAFPTAPVNAMLEGSREGFWFPDVECALAGLLVAALAWLRTARAASTAQREQWATAGSLSAYVPAALGLLLTAGDLRHLSTPLAFALATAVPLLVLRRRTTGPHLVLHNLGLLASLWVLSIYLVPDTGRPAPEILPLLGCEAAALAWLLPHWNRLAAGSRIPEAAARANGVGVLCLVLALGAVGLNAAEMGFRTAPEVDGVLLALATAACVLAGARALQLSARPHTPALVHLFLLGIITLYGFLALRTGWLSMLDGHHADALVVMAATLFLTAGRGETGRRAELQRAAMVLPLVGVLALPFSAAAQRSTTLFLIAAAYGIGALTARRGWLAVSAVVFLNLALFALWLARGIYDPSFYGVPAGLSVLLTTEMARSRLGAGRVGALRFVGLAWLYGSVAVQVLQVEQPWHALLLFGLGLISVILGFARKLNALVLAGTIAVILDVIVYLAKHGLERDFVGSFLLISSGITVLTVAAMTARQRARKQGATS